MGNMPRHPSSSVCREDRSHPDPYVCGRRINTRFLRSFGFILKQFRSGALSIEYLKKCFSIKYLLFNFLLNMYMIIILSYYVIFLCVKKCEVFINIK